MQTVIYADLLIVLNTVVTLIIIIVTSELLKIDSEKTRYIAGSFTGGVFSLIILAPPLNAVLSFLLKLLISGIIVLLSFKLRSIKIYLKCFLLFNAVGLLLAGIMLAAGMLINDNAVLSNNGYVYTDFSVSSIILIICASFFLIKILNRKIFMKQKSDLIYDAEIQYNGKKINIRAFYDSGNSLVDIFTGKPVIIVSLNEIQSLVTKDFFYDISCYFECGNYEYCPEKIRLLPVRTLGSSCFLPAFTADKLIISGCETVKITEKPCIAISDNTFNGKNYSALINEASVGQVI